MSNKIPHVYTEETPAVWSGLPDLRNKSKDLVKWQNYPLTSWQVQFLCNATRQSVNRMINDERVYIRKAFGRAAVMLGQLPQTARCQLIEHLFRDEVSIANRLHRGRELMAVLEIKKSALLSLSRMGEIHREYPPLLRPRYPHWGLRDSMQRAVEDWIDQQVRIRERDEEERESWVRFEGFSKDKPGDKPGGNYDDDDNDK